MKKTRWPKPCSCGNRNVECFKSPTEMHQWWVGCRRCANHLKAKGRAKAISAWEKLNAQPDDTRTIRNMRSSSGHGGIVAAGLRPPTKVFRKHRPSG